LNTTVDSKRIVELPLCDGIECRQKEHLGILLIGPADPDPKTELRTYGTANVELERLRQWTGPERRKASRQATVRRAAG
jgi:hypothetical protein